MINNPEYDPRTDNSGRGYIPPYNPAQSCSFDDTHLTFHNSPHVPLHILVDRICAAEAKKQEKEWRERNRKQA